MLDFNVQTQIDFLTWIRLGGVNIVAIENEDIGRIIELSMKYSDLPMDIAELSNWTGKAYIGERKHSKIIQKVEELSSPGVYLLFSKDLKVFQISLYIGEADKVNKRINDHFRGKDWWTDFIIFII